MGDDAWRRRERRMGGDRKVCGFAEAISAQQRCRKTFFFSWFSVILHNLLFSPSVVYPVFNLGICVVRQLEAFKQRTLC